MAETETETEHEGTAHRGGGGNALTRKWHGAPVWAWVLGGTVAAVVVVRIIRGRKAGGAGSSTGTSTNTANCYDVTGNLVPCPQAAATNAQIGSAGGLGGALGGFYGSSTSTGTGTSTGTTSGTTTSTSSGTSTTTGTATTTPPAPGRLTAPMGLKLTIDGKTGVRLQWNSVPHATGYVCLAKKGDDNGQVVNGPFSTTEPVCNFGGLTAGTKYTALIWPSSATVQGGPGSNQPHAEYAFSTPK